MVMTRKINLLIVIVILFCSICANSVSLPSISHSNAASDLLQINKINHQFNFSVSTQFNGVGSSTLYSIGDQISYNFSDKLNFFGKINLVTTSLGQNQFQNSFDKPHVNFDLGLNYNFNENSSFQLRLIKNSLPSNYNIINY